IVSKVGKTSFVDVTSSPLLATGDDVVEHGPGVERRRIARDARQRGFQTACELNENARALEQPMGGSLFAEADAAMDLDIFPAVLDGRRTCNEECALDLEGGVVAVVVHGNRGKAHLIAGATGCKGHVGAVVLDRLKASDRTSKLLAHSR